jgi:hypothetical protein
MRRKASVHGNGKHAVTPDLPTYTPDTNIRCARCRDKEEYIVRLRAQIEGLQKVVRDKQEFLDKKQDFIAKMMRVIAEEGAQLKPVGTKRPAQKGAGL